MRTQVFKGMIIIEGKFLEHKKIVKLADKLLKYPHNDKDIAIVEESLCNELNECFITFGYSSKRYTVQDIKDIIRDVKAA